MAQSQYLLLLAMLAAIGVLAFWLRSLRTSFLEPAVAFLGAWCVIVAFAALGFVTYDRVLTTRSFVLLVASIGAFVAGAAAAKTLCGSRSNDGILAPSFSSWCTLSGPSAAMLVAGGIAYLSIQARDIGEFLAGGGLQAFTLTQIREEFLGEAVEALTPLSVAKAVVRGIALMAAAAVPAFLRMRRPFMAAFGTVNALALLSESMLAGGRIVLAYVALARIYMHLHTAQAAGGPAILRLRRMAGLGGVALVMFYGLLVAFPAARNPALIEKTDLFLGFVHTAQVSDWVWKLSDRPALASLPVFAFASTYLSQPVVKYTFFIEGSDVADWHMHGAYNFPIPAKIVSLATGSTSSWVGIRANLAAISEQRGYSGNPWATGVRDFNIDFGTWGSVLAIFLFGAASQWLYEKATGSRLLEWRVLCALAAPLSFFFPFFSPFPIGVFFNTVVIALAWSMLAETLRDRRGQSAGAPPTSNPRPEK
jgi:hypothetical protein